jgi:membrane protease YdiL (CAAX protease family)
MVAVVRRLPLAAFFALAFGLSLVALLVIGLPRIDATTPSGASFVMFPIMVVGVGATGVALTAITGGRQGLSDLRSRVVRWRLGAWYLALLIPPGVMLFVLAVLSLAISRYYVPGLLVFGFAAGILAGFCEELGWTGFAFPRMWMRLGAFAAALSLGGLWGLWHFPVVDSLGAASPHGRYWVQFFLSFVVLLVAVRVLISWLYIHTGSVLIAQLFHASFTGSLVLFSPPHVSPAQEAGWYLLYALTFWLVVTVVLISQGADLGKQPAD